MLSYWPWLHRHLRTACRIAAFVLLAPAILAFQSIPFTKWESWPGAITLLTGIAWMAGWFKPEKLQTGRYWWLKSSLAVVSLLVTIFFLISLLVPARWFHA